MRTVILLAALLVGCAAGQTHVSWPSVVQCGQPVAGDLLGSVVSVLGDSEHAGGTIGDRAVSELEQLATAHGPAVVACLVSQAVASLEQIVNAPRARSLSAPPEAEAASFAAARGRDFLQRVAKTRVE